jgi:D-alanyl-D-alanine carboxypeptidase
MGTRYEQQKSQVGSVYDMAYFVLHLIAGAQQFRNLFAMKVPKFRHS